MIKTILDRVNPIVKEILEYLVEDDDTLEYEVGAVTEPYMIMEGEDVSVGMEQYIAIWLVLHEDGGDSALTTKVTIPLHLATEETIRESLHHTWNHVLVSRMEHQFSEVGE